MENAYENVIKGTKLHYVVYWFILTLSKARALYRINKGNITSKQALLIAIEGVSRLSDTSSKRVLQDIRTKLCIDPLEDESICADFVTGRKEVEFSKWFRFILDPNNGCSTNNLEALILLERDPDSIIELNNGRHFDPKKNNYFINSMEVIKEKHCENSSTQVRLKELDPMLGLSLLLVQKLLKEEEITTYSVEQAILDLSNEAELLKVYITLNTLDAMVDNYGPIGAEGLAKYTNNYKEYFRTEGKEGFENTELYQILEALVASHKDEMPKQFLLERCLIGAVLLGSEDITITAN